MAKSKATSASLRLIVAGVVGIVVAAGAMRSGAVLGSLLAGWAALALVFLIWTWAIVGRMNASATSSHATREDPSIAVTDGLVIITSLASLGATGVVMASSNGQPGPELVIALISLALSWILVHTTFMLRYARLYYGDKPGGIDFNQSNDPRYTDFAYTAFTIGMTYQVSDNELQTTAIRATALRQALLSYLFGAVILAGVINLVAGLSSSK